MLFLINSVINKIFKFINIYIIPRKPFHKTHVYSGDSASLPSIAIAILIIEKDLHLLQLNIESLRRFCQNPISNIFVISPANNKIKEQCQLLEVTWIDEEVVAPVKREKIHEFLGESFRLNWFYQQFIKLNLDTVITENHYLIIDADTILLNDQYFVSQEHMLLKVSDEYFYSYQVTNKGLIDNLSLRYQSFITHQQLISREILYEMKKRITFNGGHGLWDNILNAIKTNGNWFSEYELYGSFASQFYGDKIKIVYWHNKNSYVNNFTKSYLAKLEKKFVSASFHNYSYESYLNGMSTANKPF